MSNVVVTLPLVDCKLSALLFGVVYLNVVPSLLLDSQDDRYFLSGSLDARLRLWNIPDKKVALWNEVEGSGKFWLCDVPCAS